MSTLTTGSAATGWSRGRLRMYVGLLTLTAASLIAAAVWGAISVLSGERSPVSTDDADPKANALVSDERQDITLALPAELAVHQGATLTLPPATTTGPAGVPSGFPRTPEGAVAQLAALDEAVLEGMSIPAALAAAEAWIAPGGPVPTEWSVVRGLEALLTTAQQPAQGSALQLELTAAMAKVETDPTVDAGASFDSQVVACVDFVLSLVGVATEQIAAADCQRMTWTNSRWLIAPGPEQPSPTSLWPGTPESLAAGWRWVVNPDD